LRDAQKIIGPLSDPAAAFDVAVPSLPGYGFSGPTNVRGITVARSAELFVSLMAGRFAAQGGERGSFITSALAQTFPATLSGIHLNMLPVRALASQDVTDAAESNWQRRRAQWVREESADSHIQGTRPQTLAYGPNDSPAGLVRWIVEKYRAWSDCHGKIESVFSKDELLTRL
jgi:pimeloyl-ACP methyl ester carboxylesterase